jgi:4-hydroxy-tetrahydrodipicolinate reductase
MTGAARPPTATVVGADGRLGSAVASVAAGQGWRVRAVTRQTPAGPGVDPGLVIDTSHQSALGVTLALCEPAASPLVYCVSVISPAARARLLAHARTAPVVIATNLALLHWVQSRLVEHAASLLRGLGRPDVRVLERHPAGKADRPSATAVALAERWSAATDRARPPIVSERSGGPVSDHHVELVLGEETLRLTHEVHGLAAAAAGAVRLARWIGAAPPGLHAGDHAMSLALAGRHD